MRIIAGKGKGTKLFTKKGNTTRPTADRVKEALFSIISDKILGAEVLDLFGGSGALGLESLSRGVSFVTFCDNDRESINIIKQNIEKTKNVIGESAALYHIDGEDFLEKTDKEFDLIFLDPPYGYNIEKILNIIHEKNIIKSTGLIIYETEINIEEFENYIIIDKRKYGRPYVIFLKHKRGNDGSI